MVNKLWFVVELLGAFIMFAAVLPFSVSLLADNTALAFWSLIAFVVGLALLGVGSWFSNSDLRTY